MSKVIRVRYEKCVLRPLEPLVLGEGEEVEVVIKRRVFKEEDYRELVGYLARLPKGNVKLLGLAEELYLEEALR